MGRRQNIAIARTLLDGIGQGRGPEEIGVVTRFQMLQDSFALSRAVR